MRTKGLIVGAAVFVALSGQRVLAQEYAVFELPEGLIPASTNASHEVAGGFEIAPSYYVPAKYSVRTGDLQLLDGNYSSNGIDSMLISDSGLIGYDRDVGGNEVVGTFAGSSPLDQFNYGQTFGEIKLSAINGRGFAVGSTLCPGAASDNCHAASFPNKAVVFDLGLVSNSPGVTGWPVFIEPSNNIVAAGKDINDSNIVAGGFAEFGASGWSTGKAALFEIVPSRDQNPLGQLYELRISRIIPLPKGVSDATATAITNGGQVLVESYRDGKLIYGTYDSSQAGAKLEMVRNEFQSEEITISDLADDLSMVGRTSSSDFVVKLPGQREWKSLSAPGVLNQDGWKVLSLIQAIPNGDLLVYATKEQPGPDPVRYLLLNRSRH